MKLPKNLLALFFFFILLRLVFIFTFPPFTDESVHIRWGRLMVNVPGFAWSSLSYLGKQPLAFWSFGFMGDLLNNPLIGGRIVTLLFSLPSFWIIYKLVDFLNLKEKTKFTSLFILTFCPIFILFQSLALMDAFLLTATLLVIFLLLKYKQSTKIIYLFYLGLVMGVSFWIKTNIVIVFLPILLSLLYIEFIIYRHKLTLIFKLLIPLIVFLLLSVPLFFRTDFQKVYKETNVFSFSLSEIIELPVVPWINNLNYSFLSLLIYLGPLVFLLTFFSLKQIKKRNLLFLWLFFLLLIFPIIVLGKIFTTRYFLFALAPLIPLLGVGAEEFFWFFKNKENLIRNIYYSILIIYSIFFILFPLQFFYLFTDKLIISREKDYVLTNGYGTLKTVEYFDNKQNKGTKTLILVPDRQGNPSDFLLAYYYFNPQYVVGFLSTKIELKNYENILGKTDIYFVSRKSALPSDLIPYLTEIKSFKEKRTNGETTIYKINN